ncbi:MAG: acetate kinase [Desulfotalea sp.]
MKILVINSGSSSIKFQLLDMADESVLASGLVERVGEKMGEGDNLSCTFRPDSTDKAKTSNKQVIENHSKGMAAVIEMLEDKDQAVMLNRSEIGAVGHRIVHGGEFFHKPSIIDEKVKEAIAKMKPLAPLHNPPGLDGIRVAQEIFAEIPHVAVFDTAFYQTIPPRAHIYALPYELYTEDGIRRYGFHGTSHKFVVGEMAKILGKNATDCNMITVHLGNGCSMTAVEKGLAIDTSMGVTPLEGLVMGTRCGDIDPAIFDYLHREKDMSVAEINTMFNKNSGLKGICGLNDMRDIHDMAEKGDKRAQIAVDVQTYKIKKYIGSYMAALGQVDAIVFTAGIGENDDIVRARSLENLENFGIKIDTKINAQRAKEPLCISTDDSTIKVWVVPTNEELAIARETKTIVQ